MPRFWDIVRRRWPILVLVPLIALGIGVFNYTRATRTYIASGEVAVNDLSPQPSAPQGYANYYRDLSSEAATDDLLRVVPGSRFAAAVTMRLHAQGQGADYTVGDVRKALSATRVYRILTVSAVTGNADESVMIAQAALQELAANAPDYFPQRPVQATIIDSPMKAVANSLKVGVLAVGTLFAGILAAVAIALLVELFDTRLHDRREVEDVLGLPVVGAIPRRPGAERAA